MVFIQFPQLEQSITVLPVPLIVSHVVRLLNVLSVLMAIILMLLKAVVNVMPVADYVKNLLQTA